MSKSPLQDGVERLSRIAGSAAGQIMEVTRDGSGTRLVDKLLEELQEAAAEVRAMLEASSWRMPEDEMERRIQHLIGGRNINEHGVDPFGAEPAYMRKVVPVIEFLYRVYFRTEAHNIDRVPDGRVLLIANHSGQLPFDGMVIGTALLLERDPPRMIRAMVEKFVPTLPFFGTFVTRCGQVTGLPDNCRLVERKREGDGEIVVLEMSFDVGYSRVGLGLGRMANFGGIGSGLKHVRLHIRLPERIPVLEEILVDDPAPDVRVRYSEEFLRFGDQRAPKSISHESTLPGRDQRWVLTARFQQAGDCWLLKDASNTIDGRLVSQLRIWDVSTGGDSQGRE